MTNEIGQSISRNKFIGQISCLHPINVGMIVLKCSRKPIAGKTKYGGYCHCWISPYPGWRMQIMSWRDSESFTLCFLYSPLYTPPPSWRLVRPFLLYLFWYYILLLFFPSSISRPFFLLRVLSEFLIFFWQTLITYYNNSWSLNRRRKNIEINKYLDKLSREMCHIASDKVQIS